MMSDDDVLSYAKTFTDEQMFGSFKSGIDHDIVVDDELAWCHPDNWGALGLCAYEVGRRTQRPDTVNGLLLRDLAITTQTLLAAIAEPSQSLASWTREFVRARGRLLLDDIGLTVADATAAEAL
jgi:hypothetical protein